MANEEHLAILKQGVKSWNKWREENLKVLPDPPGSGLTFDYFLDHGVSEVDLSGANLQEANLVGANLIGANLRGSTLKGAIFAETNLIGADLSDVDATGAILLFANLGGVNFKRSNLSEANLSFSLCIETDFQKTNLMGANLSGSVFQMAHFEDTIFGNSILGGTHFNDTDLAKCIGLENVLVNSPCSFDFPTLQTTANLPKTFLRKMGFPPLLADYLPDFYTPTLRLFPVYLAHASANKAFVSKLYEALIQKGVQVWFDIKKLKPGDEIYEGISRGITHYDKMILVCSRESLAESWWVDREIDRVLKKERELFRERSESIHLLIPIAIDDYVFQWNGAKGEDVRRYTIGDFKEWQDEAKFDQALNELIQALHVDRPDVKPPSFL